jgi:hypothetical protein
MRPLDQLRNLARGKVHAGYRWGAIMADGGFVCEPCVRKEYKVIWRATRYTKFPDRQWQCVGVVNSGDAEADETCDHCGKLHFEVST